ncbi:GntR family transcriptional regulator [Methylobacterium nodulans]|uniref:Transcriptional regulator, GntR family n=1 Tax=Methylobacterium nodulans (strain LMG 21967 / CNCM I-2342 / ORS 2060) TaxID=460265 RepID=B8IQJ3_METNO|nr:GntR family transcriptional regulator [Methylobacterium nodulans]ACL60505.1 transcriptional regulator, GntR family [Methylobacterium nodulans ORS 2060]
MAETRLPITQVSKENLSARIYSQMRRALMDGQFEPGERLTISRLAEQFGTSITPVREAIFRLVSERVLEMRAATAVHVPPLDPARLREVQLIRIELEGAAAERAAQIITEKQLAELTAIHERFLAAAAVDPAEACVRNRDFHFALLRVAELPILEGIVENAWVLMGPFLRMFHVHIPKRQLAADQHLHHDVLDALRRRDAKAARHAIQDDIRWGNVLIDALERERDENRSAAAR